MEIRLQREPTPTRSHRGVRFADPEEKIALSEHGQLCNALKGTFDILNFLVSAWGVMVIMII